MQRAWSILMTEENARLPKTIHILKSDIQLLDHIITRRIYAKSFDFDGIKYKAKEATAIKLQLEAELINAEKKLVDLDNRLLNYFYSLALKQGRGDAYLQQYKTYIELRHESDRFLKLINETIALISPFYHDESITIETVNEIITDLKTTQEPAFKTALLFWLEQCDMSEHKDLENKATEFISKDYRYFLDNSFLANELEEYQSLLREMWTMVSQHQFMTFKDMLVKQEALMNAQIQGV
jgi:hypothetical protein